MATTRKLNGMIRNAHPLRISFHAGNQTRLDVEITKQSALQAVAAKFPDGGETGLCVNEEGYLTREA